MVAGDNISQTMQAFDDAACSRSAGQETQAFTYKLTGVAANDPLAQNIDYKGPKGDIFSIIKVSGNKLYVGAPSAGHEGSSAAKRQVIWDQFVASK